MLLRDNIYRAIRGAILTCEFQPGQELREQTLAERYRVSRSPIRDSLLRLEYAHLVTVLPRQGYRVNPISVSDVEDISGMRMLIESACAAGAARRDDDAVRTLARFRCYNGDGNSQQTFPDHNRAFHHAIADLSGNPRMAAVAHDLVEQFERLVNFCVNYYLPSTIEMITCEHQLIIDAILAHDVDRASRVACEHVQAGRSRVLAALWADAEAPEAVMEMALESDPQS
jgi:DNA-binding GntR family transcriptional regulator